jgi:hypothetical protein
MSKYHFQADVPNYEEGFSVNFDCGLFAAGMPGIVDDDDLADRIRDFLVTITGATNPSLTKTYTVTDPM